MREGHSQMAALLGDVRGLLERLATAATAPRANTPQPLPSSLSTTAHVAKPRPPAVKPAPPARPIGQEARGAEMADALAAAVERLRERAQTAAELRRRPSRRARRVRRTSTPCR